MEGQISYAEYKHIFQKDADGCYVNLIVPAFGDMPELNLSGKRPETYTVDETIQLKKYAGKMFRMVDKSTM